MTKKKLKKIQNELAVRMAAVALERDKLDEFISEFEELREDCDNAYDHLQDARDALSELV